MTTVTIRFAPQPDIARLFDWRDQLNATLVYGNGKARIDFEIDVDAEYFGGECAEAWVSWCEIAVRDRMREYCAELRGDVKGMTLTVVAQDPPEWLLEQMECDKWARSVKGGR